jgi:hypothetical protein
MLLVIAVTIFKILSKEIIKTENICDIKCLFKDSLKKLSIKDLCSHLLEDPVKFSAEMLIEQRSKIRPEKVMNH